MMKTTIWSKQHANVAKILNEEGRYISQRGYIIKDLEEHADLVLEAYDWYVKKASQSYEKPEDVTYPVWCSFSQEATMLLSENTVILQLEVDSSLIMPVNINKWGIILNYGYIPENMQDELRHKQLLEDYGTTDAKAYMSLFFPEIKREIISSWDRLFDDNIIINNDAAYGTLWELKKEWVVKIIQ